MYTFMQSQAQATFAGSIGSRMIGGLRTIKQMFVHTIVLIVRISEEQQAFEQTRSLEERLQLTGRVRYR